MTDPVHDANDLGKNGSPCTPPPGRMYIMYIMHIGSGD